MHVVVAADAADVRWGLASQLGLPAGASFGVGEAMARVAHPSVGAPDAVVVVTDTASDLQHVAWHAAASPRSWVPVVAVVARPALTGAARAAGAAAVLVADPRDVEVQALEELVSEVTAPAVVIDLASLRESA